MWHMKTVGSAPIEKSFPSVASQRDVGTIVLLLRSKRKSRMLRLKGTAARRKARVSDAKTYSPSTLELSVHRGPAGVRTEHCLRRDKLRNVRETRPRLRPIHSTRRIGNSSSTA